MVQSLGAYFIFYVLTIKLITCVQEKMIFLRKLLKEVQFGLMRGSSTPAKNFGLRKDPTVVTYMFDLRKASQTMATCAYFLKQENGRW